MKQEIAKFLLFIYNEHIKEDWEIYKHGKYFIYPLWFVRSTFVWLICPLLIPQYLFYESKIYKNYLNLLTLSEQEKQIKLIRKLNTNDFLNRKFGKGSMKSNKNL